MARIAAGARNRLIRLVPITVTLDGLGTETEVRGTGVSAWANVTFGGGMERREAGAAGSQQTATFRTLSFAAIKQATERWEVEFDGARWGITSIVTIDNDDTELEFTAVRKGA